MVLFQLPTGRTIMLSIEEVLAMGDYDLQGYIAYERGTIINQPFVDTALLDLVEQEIDEPGEDEGDLLFEEEDLSELLDNDTYLE